MIPKVIHYIWFSGEPKPPIVQRCIQSWKDKLPDFEIKEWNLSNYDTNKNQFMQEAILMRKWQFASDYARFDILYNYGGVYLDSDVEVVRNLDPLMSDKGFIGRDNLNYIAVETIGAEPKMQIFKDLMRLFEDDSFIMQNGQMNLIPCPQRCKEVFKKGNTGLRIYPKDFFYPFDWKSGQTKMTENTFTIHHYLASWMPNWFKR